MGKNMCTRHANDELVEFDELEHVHPSCMWGFVRAIDYHHWHFNLKRMLLQKINPRKRAKGKRSSKAKELVRDPEELQKLLNEEEKHIASARESGLNNKRSPKAQIKSLIAEEISKEGNGKERGSSISSQSRLKRTYSIHHLELPDHGFGEVCSDREHPIIFFPSNKDNGATKLWDPTKMNVKYKPDAYGKKSELSNKDASKDKLKEDANVLEIFKVNKDLFLEIVQDKDCSLRKFSHTFPGSNVKARLAKSGSFPAADLLQKRTLEPCTLKQKQSEIWSAPKGEKLPTVTLMPKLDKFKHSKHVRSKSLPLEYSSRGSKLGQALNFILETTSESDEANKEVLKPSTESKQLDQFEVREGRNQANSSAISFLSEVSSRNVSSKLQKDYAKRYEKTATSRLDEENSFNSYETEVHSFSKNTRSHKRSSSLNESMDKYKWLFENNFGKEVNLYASRSLKVRNEYEMGSGGNASIFFRRIRSLSNADIYSSIQNGVYGDANLEGWPITMVEENSSCEKDSCLDELKPVVVSPTTEESVPAEDIEESVRQNELLEKVGTIHQMDKLPESTENITGDCSSRMEDIEKEADEVTVGESTLNVDQESKCSAISPSELPSCPDPALETYFGEEVSSSEEIQEGLQNRCDHFDETDSSINCWKSFGIGTSSLLSSMPNFKNPDHLKDAQFSRSYNEHDADLDYVKDILESSGFEKDAFHKTWHSSNQPLDPLVFDEMESYWHKECSAEDYCGCYHHFLFDLVNEKLLHIYQRSFTYYPKALSSSCYIRPFPVGDHIVDEMCTSVNTLMRLKPEQKQSLECLVALDMGKDDGWMNLQLESECVGLELEDLILDELLEELVCS